MSEFESRKSKALALLHATGMRESNYAPPLLRLLWRFGLEVPPPHFASFGAAAVVAGTFFAVTWGLLMWFLVWRDRELSGLAACAGSVMAGLVFGFMMAAYYAWGRRKHQLPAWRDIA